MPALSPRGTRGGAARLPTASTLAIDEAELARLAQVASRLLAGRPLLTAGHQPAPRRAGQGSEFLEHRDYGPGDDLRRIDWRASARSRRMQVRRYHDEASADWYLCVDASASMASADAGKWRLAQQLAVALAYILLDLGQRVGAIAFANGPVSALPVGRGRHQLTRLLARLCALGPQSADATSLAALEAHLGPRDPIFVLSDFLREDGLRSDLARLAHGGRELHAIMIGAPADLSAPAATSVEDAESGELLELRDAPHGAPARWVRLHDDLQSFCRRQQVVLSVCEVGESWRDIVLRHLRAANRQIG